jgi:hypothetical protein
MIIIYRFILSTAIFQQSVPIVNNQGIGYTEATVNSFLTDRQKETCPKTFPGIRKQNQTPLQDLTFTKKVGLRKTMKKLNPLEK